MNERCEEIDKPRSNGARGRKGNKRRWWEKKSGRMVTVVDE
jgi:hypothetical protein